MHAGPKFYLKGISAKDVGGGSHSTPLKGPLVVSKYSLLIKISFAIKASIYFV